MKYNISINQKKSVEWELSTSEAIVFSWIYSLPSWSDSVSYNNGTYYFGGRNKACEELPIVTDKRDTMYRIFKSLSDKNIISIICLDKKDYIALTDKGREWYDGDLNTDNGKKSEKTRKKIRENSEKNPTYNNISYNDIIDNKEIEDKSSIKKEDQIDYALIENEWNTICSKLPNVRGISPKRKTAIKNTLKNNNANANDLIKCFKIIASSDFLNGNNSRKWCATFDWITTDTKGCFNRLLEGEFSKSPKEHKLYEDIINDANIANKETNAQDETIINGTKYQ